MRNEFIAYLENITLFLLGLLLLAFPLFVVTFTTDPFNLPKQILLGTVSGLALLLWGAKMVALKSVRIRTTRFDIPVLLLTLTIFLSSLFARNRADSLIAFVPFLFAALAFFVLTNTAKGKNNLLFLVSSLVVGAVLLATNASLSFFKFYALPFSFAQAQNFTPAGSLLDQAIYLAVVLPIALFFAVKLLKEPKNLPARSAGGPAGRQGLESKTILFAIASIAIIMGLLVTLYQLFNPPAGGQKPLILPFETGFQTAFAAISQDAGRTLQGFLVGSGFGTYVTDFTRFKQIAFNQNQTLWATTFFRSSSAFLELLATTGVLGISAFLFLTIRVIREIRAVWKAKSASPLLISFLLLLISLFFLPLSFVVQTLFFLLPALFAISSGNTEDLEFQLVSLKKGVISLEPVASNAEKSIILPSIVVAIILAIIAFLSYPSTKYVLSDIAFQESLVAANNNNGALTYQKQSSAISLFKEREVYYRVFSQTNLALANSLLSQQPRGASPSAQVQQTITTLIQQSIDSGRRAVSLSPQSALNWNNLSSVYRSLIGFGQNAENFALATAQQAAALDPNNPQQYLNLGGIYFQLGNYENAQTQFQIAINLKPDFANAYYNLGHVFLNKNEFDNALRQFTAVKSLVANDKASLAQITKEIEDIEKRNLSEKTPASSSETLNLNKPQTQLPSQNPPVVIPAPQTEPTAIPNATPSSK